MTTQYDDLDPLGIEIEDLDGFEEFEPVEFDPLEQVLAASPDPDAEWLWCIFCERFFQARFLRIDFQGQRQGCAFCECAGFECAIFRWDTWREDGPGWPQSVTQLRHGMRLGD